jgi:phosphatidylinositol-3-phosphatase
MRQTALALTIVTLLVCGCGAMARSGPVRVPQACGLRTSPPAAWRHVVWIWLENEGYANVIGSRSAPFLTRLGRSCGIATNYFAITHPSLPNYLAATSGSTWNVVDDGSPSSHPVAGPSIFAQIAAAGLTWRSFEESMPKRCDLSSTGKYAVKHNPAAYYVGVRSDCSRWDVPLQALRVDALPSFSFVTPNICNDMHSCPVATGDRWLQGFVQSLVAGASYRAGDTVLFITFDEGEGSSNRVATVVVAPSTRPGTVSAVRFDHYSLLATSEKLLQLPRLRAAADMARPFGLVR